MLFAFMLIAVASAADGCTVPPCVSLPDINPVANPGFIGAIILLSVAFSALSYAVSYSIQNASAIAWSKEMLRETIVGVAIVVMVYGVAATANALVVGLTGYGNIADVGSGPVELGEAALEPIIGNLTVVYNKIGEAYFSVAVQQGTSISWSATLIPKLVWWQPSLYYGRDVMPYYGLSPILQALTIHSQNIMLQILSFRVVQLLLLYIKEVVPGFLLPLGFVFRVFPITKRTGDTLIALSLGGLFMLPASLIVVDELGKAAPLDNVRLAERSSFSDNVDPAFFSSANFLKKGLCENTPMRILIGFGEIFWATIFALIASAPELFATFGFWFEFFLTIIWPFALWVIQLALGAVLLALTLSLDSAGLYDTTIAPIVSILIPAASEITVFSVMCVVVIAVITYTGTKAIASALGGEYMLYGLSRLI